MCVLSLLTFFFFFSTFLPVVKGGGDSTAFSFPCIFETKKRNKNLKPPEEVCSFQNFSRLGGEIYINKLLSSSFGNLDLILRS